jgi:hypothetical protein
MRDFLKQSLKNFQSTVSSTDTFANNELMLMQRVAKLPDISGQNSRGSVETKIN